MSAIKLFHGEVSEDLLLKERQFEALRTKLLRGAADFYGKLEGLLKGQTDPKSRAALGKAYYELGELTGEIGNKPEALAVHLKALAVRRQLGAAASGGRTAEPAWREARLDVARSLIAAGLIREDTGDTPGALASYEEARDLAEGLKAFGHAETAVRAVLGTSHLWIGYLYFTSGKPALALAAYEQARSIRQTLVDAEPAVSEYQSDLAECHYNIGLVLAHTGRPNESLAAFEQARAIQQKLTDTNPSVTQFQRKLAATSAETAATLRRAGRLSEALAVFEKGRAIQQRLADANPNVTLFQSDLARHHNNIGMLFSNVGKPAEALAAVEKGRAIRQVLADANPRVTRFQRDLAISLLMTGQLRQNDGQAAQAVDAYHKALAILERLPELAPYDQFNVAMIHGGLAALSPSPGSGLSAARGRAEADLAVIWLRQAAAGGLRPPAKMLTGPEFEPLLSRPDFRLLLMDLAFPDEPFARPE
jgi:tetratricopeptide (TPR) repeat protein